MKRLSALFFVLGLVLIVAGCPAGPDTTGPASEPATAPAEVPQDMPGPESAAATDTPAPKLVAPEQGDKPSEEPTE